MEQYLEYTVTQNSEETEYCNLQNQHVNITELS